MHGEAFFGDKWKYYVVAAYALEDTNVTAEWNKILLRGVSGVPAYAAYADDTVEVAMNHNSVEIFDGATAYDVAGAFAADNSKSTATGNTVTVHNATISHVAYGGRTGRGEAASNAVNITAGSIATAYGGYSEYGTAIENQLTMSGGTITGNAYGGYTQSYGSEAKNNTLTMKAGTIGSAYGGYSYEGDATQNMLTMEDGTIKSAYGGYVDATGGAATGNRLTMNDGEITKEAYGAFTAGHDDGDATNNTLTMNGGKITGEA